MTEEPPKRRPSPTSRARRAAAAGLGPAGEQLRARESAAGPAADPEADPTGPESADTTSPPASAVSTAPPASAVSAAPPVSAVRTYRRVGRPPVIMLALVAAVLLAVNGVLLRSDHSSSSAADREQVLAAAKSDTALVISYNYKTVSADAAKAMPHLTGSFAADYSKSMDQVIKVQAPKVKAVVEGQVDSAAIEAVSPNGTQVTVIVFGQQKVTNSALSQPRMDLVRLRVTMDRIGSDWKVSQLAQI